MGEKEVNKNEDRDIQGTEKAMKRRRKRKMGCMYDGDGGVFLQLWLC